MDTQNIVSDKAQANDSPDYALVKVIGRPEFSVAHLSHSILRQGQGIRLVHHPRGEAVQISDIGQVVQVEQEFMKHNIEADYGSSGAPIFDLDWRVVALHRGAMTLSRPTAPGITECIPIFSIWQAIQPHLQPHTA